MNIKFGTSLDEVTRIMLSKPGCIIDKENTDSTRLTVDGVKFAGRETLFILFKFIDKKFHTASAHFEAPNLTKLLELYNNIKNEINEKYYITEDDYEIYSTPYEKDDGFTESAIKLGKASFSAYWKSKNKNSTDSVDNYIALSITENLFVRLSYQDGELVKIATARNKKKNSADY